MPRTRKGHWLKREALINGLHEQCAVTIDATVHTVTLGYDDGEFVVTRVMREPESVVSYGITIRTTNLHEARRRFRAISRRLTRGLT